MYIKSKEQLRFLGYHSIYIYKWRNPFTLLSKSKRGYVRIERETNRTKGEVEKSPWFTTERKLRLTTPWISTLKKALIFASRPNFLIVLQSMIGTRKREHNLVWLSTMKVESSAVNMWESVPVCVCVAGCVRDSRAYMEFLESDNGGRM